MVNGGQAERETSGLGLPTIQQCFDILLRLFYSRLEGWPEQD